MTRTARKSLTLVSVGPVTTCPFTGGPWCHVVAGVGSQGLPVRALWMASMARMWWPRVLTR